MPTRHALARGSLLFRQGDASTAIFRLASGRLRLVRGTPDGTTVPMHTVRPGEWFAEAALFSTHYHCDALALADCEVLRYPRDVLTQQLGGHPQALWSLAGELAHRVQGLRTRLEIRQIRSARQRVLEWLRLHGDAGGAWVFEGTLKDVAEDLGLTHEALYRALAALERDARITRQGREIRLLAVRQP